MWIKMSLSIAKEICRLQGIKFKKEVKVICPRCNGKTLILNITDNIGNCIRCHKHYNSIEEVHKIEEANYISNHKITDIEMRKNRGDL